MSLPPDASLAGFARWRLPVRRLDRLSPALAGLLVQVVATAVTLAIYCLADTVAIGAPLTFWALVQAALAVLLASAARERLLALLPEDRPIHFVDVGCGFGGVVSSVGRERPTLECLGLETAWLPYLVSRLRCALSPNHATIARRDLWTHDLSAADVVYAYLSPVPMERLWRKVVAEMRPGTLFISNTFAVPGIEPLAAYEIDDATGSVLHVYRLPGDQATAGVQATRAASMAVASADCS